VPHLHYFVISRRSDELAIRRPGHTPYTPLTPYCCKMPGISEESRACGSVPYSYYFVESSRSNKLPIRRPGCTPHNTSMFGVGNTGFTRYSVPHLHCFIISC